MEPTEKSRKRTQSKLKKHRLAIDLTIGDKATDRLVKAASKRYKKLLLAEQEWNTWVQEQVIDKIINKANATLEPAKQTDTLTLFTSNGLLRFAVERQIRRFMDGRAHMAKGLIEEWLLEYENKTVTTDRDSALVYEFLKSLFFGSQQKQFRWTPELMKFIAMDEAKIHDDRLRKARRLLADSIRIDRTKFYSYVEVFDEGKNEYRRMEADTELPTEEPQAKCGGCIMSRHFYWVMDRQLSAAQLHQIRLAGIQYKLDDHNRPVFQSKRDRDKAKETLSERAAHA